MFTAKQYSGIISRRNKNEKKIDLLANTEKEKQWRNGKKLKIELKLFHFQSEKTKDEYINEWRKTQNNSAMYTTYGK